MTVLVHLPFCQHFWFLFVRLDFVHSHRLSARPSRKTDKLRIPTQSHVAFAPNFARIAPLLPSGGRKPAFFPSIIKRLWIPDICSGAGIRDAE